MFLRCVRTISLLAVLTSLGPVLSQTASASIIGDQMSLSYQYPDLSTSYSQFSASPNPFIAIFGISTIGDIEGVTTLTTSFSTTGTTDTLQYLINTTLDSPTLNSVAFNGPVLTVLSGRNFGQVLSVTGLVDSSRVFDTGNMVGINLSGVSYHDGDTISVTFGISAVPLPASLPMFGAALFALGALGRGVRRRGLPTI